MAYLRTKFGLFRIKFTWPNFVEIIDLKLEVGLTPVEDPLSFFRWA